MMTSSSLRFDFLFLPFFAVKDDVVVDFLFPDLDDLSENFFEFFPSFCFFRGSGGEALRPPPRFPFLDAAVVAEGSGEIDRENRSSRMTDGEREKDLRRRGLSVHFPFFFFSFFFLFRRDATGDE